MLFVIAFVIAFFLCLLRCFQLFINRPRTSIKKPSFNYVFGTPGSGKTTFLAWIARLCAKEHKRIYTNVRSLSVSGADIVYIDNVFHRVIKIEGLTYTLQQCSYIYHDITEGSNFKYIDPVSEKIYEYEIVSVDSKPNVDKYSGKLLYNSNNVPFYMTDNKTFGLRTYIKF